MARATAIMRATRIDIAQWGSSAARASRTTSDARSRALAAAPSLALVAGLADAGIAGHGAAGAGAALRRSAVHRLHGRAPVRGLAPGRLGPSHRLRLARLRSHRTEPAAGTGRRRGPELP